MKKISIFPLKVSLVLAIIFTMTPYFNDIEAINIAAITIPKTGSNLLLKLLKLLGTPSNTYIPRNSYLPENLNGFSSNRLFWAHTIATPQTQQLLQNFKIFFIYRDPRDQIVSMAHWIKKNPQYWPQYASWTIESLISNLIVSGTLRNQISQKKIWGDSDGIDVFYSAYLPWINSSTNIYVTTFEKLIGPNGGGNKESQLQEIMNIALHLDKQISLEYAEMISNKLFGGTYTFREGKIGAWRKHFTEKHNIAFKKVAGQLLIDLEYENDLNW